MPTFRRLVGASGLDMKPVGVEYLFDGEKAVCYFAAEERVDFRQLVRDLSRELHVRIDMRQIGVREEAAIVGGYGHCGQELCCRRFNMSFDPVSIRMAKEQDLPLNSTKISGACGRLMCCLRYEFEAYRDFKGRAPKRNAVIDTPLGKGKIIEYDTPKEQICLRLESGKQIRVALADMTASEVACKKSRELGCACRPDTVTREVLDRLDSPDVQMALAELDRKNGVAPEQTVDAADIFVSTRRKRRRFKIKLLCNGNATDHMVARRRRGHQRLEPLVGIFSKLLGNMHTQLTITFDINVVRIDGISNARALKLAHCVGLLDLFFLRHVLAPDIKQPQSTARGALGSIASCKRSLSRWGRRPQNHYSRNRQYR